MSKLYTTEETAEKLRISVRTLNRYLKEGAIVAYQIGNKNLFDEVEIVKFLKRRTTKAS